GGGGSDMQPRNPIQVANTASTRRPMSRRVFILEAVGGTELSAPILESSCTPIGVRFLNVLQSTGAYASRSRCLRMHHTNRRRQVANASTGTCHVRSAQSLSSASCGHRGAIANILPSVESALGADRLSARQSDRAAAHRR